MVELQIKEVHWKVFNRFKSATGLTARLGLTKARLVACKSAPPMSIHMLLTKGLGSSTLFLKTTHVDPS